MPVLQLGLAVNGRQKDDTGNWTDKPNFFDVKVFGNQAESCAQHLCEGPPVGDRRPSRLVVVGGPGRIEALEGRDRRRFQVQFLEQARGRRERSAEPQYVARCRGVAADTSRLRPTAGSDDDIPF